MYKICVFGGTTEGRELAAFLNTQPCETTVCVATEYGQALLPEGEKLHVSAKRLRTEEIAGMLENGRYNLVIDATHPYARTVTESIKSACADTKTELWRLSRGASEIMDGAVTVEDADKAAELLSGVSGNILLTTGSKELSKLAVIDGFKDRVWARVLPMQPSLEACAAAGLEPSHIIAMQGPFSEELNAAMLRACGAKWLVTKDGGRAGGFDEKARAAKKTGARLLVIGRPNPENGKSLSETVSALCEKFGFRRRPEVFVVGIGPGSEKTKTCDAFEAIKSAGCIIGAGRMTAAASHPGQAVYSAIEPEKIAGIISEHPEFEKFAVVMSGDTGFFSGTKKLLPYLDGCAVSVIPGISSLSYLCSRIGESYEDAVTVSLHGRTRDIARDVRENGKVFVIVGGEGGMEEVCRRLDEAGLGDVQVSVGERLSYPDEKITHATAHELSGKSFEKLSAALIVNPHPENRAVCCGIPDEAFLRNMEPGHVVPMTKSEVRSICLSKLALTKNAVCWDVGAGTGSVSVEMAACAPYGDVYAIEKNPDAIELLKRNKSAFGVENMHIIAGTAPQSCEGLPAPTHAFLGGTAGNVREILALLVDRNPSVRIVATAVTLESAAELTACMDDFDRAECVSVQVSRSKSAGRYHLMSGQNPIYIFTMQNGAEEI